MVYEVLHINQVSDFGLRLKLETLVSAKAKVTPVCVLSVYVTQECCACGRAGGTDWWRMAAARAQLTADSPSTPTFFNPGRSRLPLFLHVC